MSSRASLQAEVARLEESLSRMASASTSPSTSLMRSGLEEIRDDLMTELAAAERTQLGVMLDGAPVVDHSIRVSALSKILHSLQEAVSSVGQALEGRATSRSAIPAALRERTVLSLVTVFPGSFGAILKGPARQPSAHQASLFHDEAVNESASPLLDESLEKLLTLIETASANPEDDSVIVSEVLPLGSRVFKHLNDLSTAIVDEDIEAHLSWKAPSGRGHDTAFTQTAARRLGDVLSRNRVSEEQEVLVGSLGTVSNIRNRVELDTGPGGIIRADVIEDLVSSLGDYYTHQVRAVFDVSVARSLATGRESRAYTLIALERIDRDATDPTS